MASSHFGGVPSLFCRVGLVGQAVLTVFVCLVDGIRPEKVEKRANGNGEIKLNRKSGKSS